MAYYWRCKRHSVDLRERLDKIRVDGTKIVPFCPICEAEKEQQTLYEKALEDTP